MTRRGMLLVVSAPSGAGKTTIVKEILRRIPSFKFSVSATTREKRPGEINGKDYFFLSRDEFEKRIANGDLVEHEEIYSDYYGTLKSEVEKAAAKGEDIVFDVDVNGGLSIKRIFPEAVTIFVKPPSIDSLRRRLEGRGSESVAQIKRRMERVPMELEKGARFDYIVVNDDLKSAIAQVFDIIERKSSEIAEMGKEKELSRGT